MAKLLFSSLYLVLITHTALTHIAHCLKVAMVCMALALWHSMRLLSLPFALGGAHFGFIIPSQSTPFLLDLFHCVSE